jgi:hypothetical protein
MARIAIRDIAVAAEVDGSAVTGATSPVHVNPINYSSLSNPPYVINPIIERPSAGLSDFHPPPPSSPGLIDIAPGPSFDVTGTRIIRMG